MAENYILFIMDVKNSSEKTSETIGGMEELY